MRSAAKRLRLVFGMLVSFALAVSPAAAWAKVEAAAPHPAMTSSHTTPCDTPCDDCGADVGGAACAVACFGLAVAIPTAIAPAPSVFAVARIDIPEAVSLIGRDREPDKPPPRPFLA